VCTLYQSVALVGGAVALALRGCLPDIHKLGTVTEKSGMSIAEHRLWHYMLV
jgi:hypothetical protein